jgi:hypothetical protein
MWLFVEDQLALPGDFQPVERPLVFDADLVLAPKQRRAVQRSQGHGLMRTQVGIGAVPSGDNEVVAGVAMVHGVEPRFAPGLLKLAGRRRDLIS